MPGLAAPCVAAARVARERGKRKRETERLLISRNQRETARMPRFGGKEGGIDMC